MVQTMGYNQIGKMPLKINQIDKFITMPQNIVQGLDHGLYFEGECYSQ